MDQRGLNDVFDNVRKKSQNFVDFGLYDRLTRTQAASAQGLHHNEKLLKCIITFCPTAEIQHHQLRDAMLQFPLMNDSSLKTNLWAALKSERIATMLCHVRRIARDQLRMRQCLCKATDKEVQLLHDLARSVAAGDVSEDECSGQVAQTRQLQRNESVASSVLSLDSDGFPKMLAALDSDMARDTGRRGMSDTATLLYDEQPNLYATSSSHKWGSPSRASCVDNFDAVLAAAALEATTAIAERPFKRPAAAKNKDCVDEEGSDSEQQPARKKPAARQLARKKPAANRREERPAATVSSGTYSVTKATHKSYIQNKIAGKKVCMINCTAAAANACGKDHKVVIEYLHQELLKGDLTKDALVTMRNEFLAT